MKAGIEKVKKDSNKYIPNLGNSKTGAVYDKNRYYNFTKEKKSPCLDSFKCCFKEFYNSKAIEIFADVAANLCPEEFSGIGFGRQFYGAMPEGRDFEEQFKNYMELMNWCRSYRDELVAHGLLCPDDKQYFFRALQYIFNTKFPDSGHQVDYDKQIFKCPDVQPYVNIVNKFPVDIVNKSPQSRFLLLDVNWYPMALYWLNCNNGKEQQKGRTYLTFESRDYNIAINILHQISLYILENFDVSKVVQEKKVIFEACDFSTIHDKIKDFSQEARLSPADYAEKILFPTWCNTQKLAYYPILEQDTFKPLALKGNSKEENEYKRPDFMIYCNDSNQNKAIFVDVKTVEIKQCTGNIFYLNNVKHTSYSIYDPMYFACYKNENQEVKVFKNTISVKEYQQNLLDKECPNFLQPNFVELKDCCDNKLVAFTAFSSGNPDKPFECCNEFTVKDCQETTIYTKK